MRVLLTSPLVRGYANLIDVIPKYEVPHKHKVLMYYGHNAPKGAFKAVTHFRLIFMREELPCRYVVIPDIQRNAFMWRVIYEHEKNQSIVTVATRLPSTAT